MPDQAHNAIDVLVVGDANPDLVLRGDVVPRFGQAEQILDGADLVLGGSAAIVACGLARLGVRTALAAVVGDDSFGRFTLSVLEEAGVDISAVRVDAEVPTGLSVILSAPGDRSILTRPGTISSLRPEHVDEAVARLRPRHVHVASYFLQPGLAAGLPALLEGIRSAGAHPTRTTSTRTTVSLDTNWDPTEQWDGLAEVLGHVDYLLPNREELSAIAGALTGTDVATDVAADVDAAAASIARLGPVVVMKAGKAGGLSFADGRERIAAPGLQLEVVDTTGAGDSFDAGYLAAVIDGIDDEAERVSWAAIAGSLSTRAAGGTAAQATRAELRSELERRELERRE
ncbi:carbohydrate kinase family protein [Glaciibacter superstes]|uniref:carbohydrate kinase family protein n=1 Tax=Glaciibacter superstes TaxID=501023 RepID=UPI0003B402F4|nr:PfkB family carbohydrate kinase [Glaciibacter superstes]